MSMSLFYRIFNRRNEMQINEIAARQYDWVERMGWHNKTVLEALALIASEVVLPCGYFEIGRASCRERV